MDFEKLQYILPKDPIKWNSEDVGIWLNFIGLGNLYDKFQQATIDGACLSHITEDDLINDLGVSQGIIRKKLLNWINMGIKEYSVFLQKFSNIKMEQEQIPYQNMPFNVFQKQCLENEFLKNQYNKLETTNQSNNSIQFSIENNNNQFHEMATANIKFLKKQQSSEIDFEIEQTEILPKRKTSQIIQENSSIVQKNQIGYKENKENIPQNKEIINKIGDNCNQQINQSQFQNQKDDIAKKVISQLIIQPTEGPQTNFFCINQEGGKIGRQQSNQILILDESISRFHAEIIFKETEFYLFDVGSTTGTFIKITDLTTLEEGMIIEMGSNQFLVKSCLQNELILHIIEGPNINQTFCLKFDEQSQVFNIGRKQNNFISMPDDHHMSNLHSRIYQLDKKFILEDYSSTNGSWQRLSKESEKSKLFQLKDMTIFKIGTSQTYICKKNSMFFHQSDTKLINACVICCENDSNALFMPCKHNCSCIKCSKTLKECPICRTKLEDCIKIYKA